MEIIDSLEKLHSGDVPCVIALGTFDGLHLGHQDVISTARQYADKYACRLAVFTFSNHPYSLINPKLMPTTLITCEDKHACLEALGVDILVEIPFEMQLANLKPIEFIKKLQQLDFRCLVVGANFSFGSHGAGKVDTLAQFADELGFELIVRSLVSCDNAVVSSTRIRRLIKEGNIKLANQMLGRKYSISGTVVQGNQRGRLLNFATANVELAESKLTPPHKGVYAVTASVRGKTYQGMANVGINPTFGDVEAVRLETNIFDFNESIYGEKITVSFYEFIRDEQKFSSADELIRQLEADRKQCRDILKSML